MNRTSAVPESHRRDDTAALASLNTATRGHARTARASDGVAGVPARYVALPCDTAQAAAVMTVAAEYEMTVLARGSGTKLSWGGAPASVDLLIDTSRMDAVIEHNAGDLIVHTQAGLTLTALARRLSPAGQRLAIDPPAPSGSAAQGTVGGVISTAASGPLRLSFGAVRDLLIGVTMVRADGVIAHAGGKVVKNVAGYDLGKLLAGSFGTIGVMTEAIFRLHPYPPAQRWVSVPIPNSRAAHDVTQRVIHSHLAPSALELDRPNSGHPSISVLLEGTHAGVADRSATMRELLGAGAVEQEIRPPWWGRRPWDDRSVALRLTHQIASLQTLIDALDAATRPFGFLADIRGAAGVGILHAVLPADPTTVTTITAALRAAAATWGGDVVILDAPADIRAALDIWGPVNGLALMRRIKDQFDPEHRLAPGRFVGGI